MKAISILFALLSATTWSLADNVSGPGCSTIQRFPWGSIYYEHNGNGPYQLDPIWDGFRFKSNQGQVTIEVVHVNGYRLSCGQEVLTLGQNLLNLDIQKQEQRWTLHAMNGNFTLESSFPRDTLVFTRNANTFTVKGGQGTVTGTTQFEKLNINSPLGTSTITTNMGHRTVSGVALDQIPYLGRGLYIPFHGVGIFIDMMKMFPMPEIAEWIEWKPIVLGA